MVKLIVSCSDVFDQPTEHHDAIDCATTHGFSASRVDTDHHIGLRTHGGEPPPPLSTLASSLTKRVCSNTLDEAAVGSEAARLGGDVCARCHLGGSIAGYRARRPVSMGAAPPTFGDSQVLLRRTPPEGAKSADGWLNRR